MTDPAAQFPHESSLPQPLVRKRKQFRITAHLLLVVAGLTGIPAWVLFGISYKNAVNQQHDPWQRAIIAYVLLIISSVTLLLGLWYLLLAQVRRIAREVHEQPVAGEAEKLICPNCGWPHDAPDRFCRHCGKPLGATIGPNDRGRGVWER